MTEGQNITIPRVGPRNMGTPQTTEVSITIVNQSKNARNAEEDSVDVEVVPEIEDKTKSEGQQRLMEAVVARENLKRAYKQVLKNDGSAGVDGMNCKTLEVHLRQHWLTIKTKLLTGTYLPQAIRKVEIPKANGGTRVLGIPTVMDRLIQQAIHQVLQPMFEPEFSDSSYGFRPGKCSGQVKIDN